MSHFRGRANCADCGMFYLFPAVICQALSWLCLKKKNVCLDGKYRMVWASSTARLRHSSGAAPRPFGDCREGLGTDRSSQHKSSWLVNMDCLSADSPTALR